MNHLRAVVWPRGADAKDANGKPVYRYVVVGLLVTDKPIPEFEGKNELVLDAYCPGIETALGLMPQRESKVKLGDAADVLASMDIL